MKENDQVKSRQRVQQHAEVFTAQREVNAMLDLVKQETLRIESRFLEPACGDGNFLAEILRRKLAVVRANYRRKPSDYEKYSLLALSSLYGVELLDDNTLACRERLFLLWDEAYTALCNKSRLAESCRQTARFLLERNILCGDALSLLGQDGQPLVFSQWSLIGRQFKRADYTLDGLLNVKPKLPDQVPLPKAPPATQQVSLFRQEPLLQQTSLFDGLGMPPDNAQTDAIDEKAALPPALPQTDEEGRLLFEYPLTDYWRIASEHQRHQSPGL
ncbi:MAG: SAM-dependent DNA methyltransferase [Christensenellales bacterium]